MNRMHHFPSPRHRPPWWPENAPWPPRRRYRYPRFFIRMGCLFAVFSLTGLAVFVLVVALIAYALGLAHFSFDVLQWAVPIALGVGVFVFASIGLGGLSLRRFSAPLDDLLEGAGRVAGGDYSAHVDERGPREVRSLARAFNDMASRLHQTDEQRRNLL